MADGGEQLLTGTIAGQLGQLVGISYPIAFKEVRPMMDEQGNYRTVVQVVMESGTYYVSITDHDPQHVIEEEP